MRNRFWMLLPVVLTVSSARGQEPAIVTPWAAGCPGLPPVNGGADMSALPAVPHFPVLAQPAVSGFRHDEKGQNDQGGRSGMPHLIPHVHVPLADSRGESIPSSSQPQGVRPMRPERFMNSRFRRPAPRRRQARMSGGQAGPFRNSGSRQSVRQPRLARASRGRACPPLNSGFPSCCRWARACRAEAKVYWPASVSSSLLSAQELRPVSVRFFEGNRHRTPRDGTVRAWNARPDPNPDLGRGGHLAGRPLPAGPRGRARPRLVSAGRAVRAWRDCSAGTD